MASKAKAVPALPGQVASSFNQLTDSAARLNAASDELAKAIAPIDAALKKLNLGITAWHKYVGDSDEHGDYWGRYIGYAKIGGKWGLALSEDSGNEGYGVDSENSWLFNEAPRAYRIESIEHIPALLEALVKAAETTATKVDEKTKQALEIAELITAAAGPVEVRR